MNKHIELSKLLIALEQELVNAKLWQQKKVDFNLLQSTQPFCHDTLKPQQWLQFVFIAKLEQLIKMNLPLPANCDITPYIQEALKEHSNVSDITKATKAIDDLLSK